MSPAVNFAFIHRNVEQKLERKIPSALSPRPRMVRERLASNTSALNHLLGSGLPVGAISEMVGVSGSGRTTAAIAFVAATVADKKVAAWVDVANALDPVSAAIGNVNLERLLWIRCTTAKSELRVSSEPMCPAVPASESTLPVRGGGSPHPRSEIHGMPEAIRSIMTAHGGLQQRHARRERKNIGTPGVPNRPLGASPYREEQVPTDRTPSRRAERYRAQASGSVGSGNRISDKKHPHPPKPAPVVCEKRLSGSRKHSWQSLDHALRATDLLLQSGGFALIVLDLGDTPQQMAWRIPLATWFRYRAACEHSRTTLLVLTQHACAQSSAEVVMRFQPAELEVQNNVLTGLSFHSKIERQRFPTQPSKVVPIRKPPQSERPGQWKGRASWAV